MQKVCLYVPRGIFCGTAKYVFPSVDTFSHVPSRICSVPANDVLVAANDSGLNVSWMVAEPSDTESLLQGTHYIHPIQWCWREREIGVIVCM